MKGYKIASHLPHRLDDYLHRVCYCQKDRRRLGLVIKIEATVASWLTGETHYVVHYVDECDTAAQIYLGDEIQLLEIKKDDLTLAKICFGLNMVHTLVIQAREEESYSYNGYCRDYNLFLNAIPKILIKNGHEEAFDLEYVLTNHVLQTRLR
jgi:hypothetical protein